MAVVDHLMDVTFAQRRNDIVRSAQSVVTILNRYWFLEYAEEVYIANCTKKILYYNIV